MDVVFSMFLNLDSMGTFDESLDGMDFPLFESNGMDYSRVYYYTFPHALRLGRSVRAPMGTKVAFFL